jgi:hypothetical protein
MQMKNLLSQLTTPELAKKLRNKLEILMIRHSCHTYGKCWNCEMARKLGNNDNLLFFASLRLREN